MAKNTKEVQIRADSKRAGLRTRNWTTICYPEDLPSNWQTMIDDKLVKWVCSPLHDKDINPDGSAKKKHYHVLFMFENVKRDVQVIEFLGGIFGFSLQGSIVGCASPQSVSDRSALIRYFCHLDNPSKAQYDVSELIGHCGADVSELLARSQSEIISMMIDMERFIEEHDIRELCDFSVLIRDNHPDWYLELTTRHTVYFSALIRSRRHKMQALECVSKQCDVDSNSGELRASESL